MQQSFSWSLSIIGILALAGVALGVFNATNQQQFQKELVTIMSQQNNSESGDESSDSIPAPSPSAVLDQKQAEQLVASTWNVELVPQEGFPAKVTISKNPNGTYAIEVVVGALDDSVASTKLEGLAIFNNGIWTLSNPPARSWVCHPGRGHQNYSTANCI